MNDRDKIFDYRLVFRIWLAGAVGLAALDAAELVFLPDFPFSFDPWVLSGPFIAQVIFERERRLVLGTLLAIPVIAAILVVWFDQYSWFAIPFAMGIASGGVLLAKLIRHRFRDVSAWFMLAAGSLLFIGQQLSQTVEQFTTYEAWTYDSRAYLVDLSLGFDVLSAAASFGARTMPMVVLAAYHATLGLVYVAIMLMMELAILLQMNNRSPRWLVALVAMMIAGFFGGIFYYLFPATGPAAAFPSFPHMPNAAQLSPAMNAIDPVFSRSCVPSMHTTWALLVVINSVGLSRRFQAVAVAFLALTLMATLVKGEHYFMDLVVAVPYAVAMQSLARGFIRLRIPGLSFWTGMGITAFWFYALVARPEWFLAIPGFTLVLTVGTIATSAIACVIDERKYAALSSPAP